VEAVWVYKGRAMIEILQWNSSLCRPKIFNV